MKKKFLFLYVFLSVFSLCFLCFNPVVSADLCDILLSDFDDVSSGSDWGDSAHGNATGLFDYENVGDVNRFEISTSGDLSAPNSLKLHPDDTDSCQGWLNLTYSFEYIHEVNFSVYLDEGTGNQIIQFDFYDGSTVVISLRLFVCNGAAQEGLQWYDISSGWHYIYNVDIGDSRCYVVFQHNYTNQFYIKFLDNAFNILGDDEYACATSGTYTGFDSIYIYQTTNQPAATGVMYIDDFYVNYCETDEGFCDNVDLVVLSQDGEPGIRNVLLDTTVVYQYTVVGDVGAKAWLWITDQDTPSIPLHIKYLGEVPAVGILTGTHNIFYNSILYSEQTYSFIVKDYPILNPSCSNYFYEVQNFTMNTTTPYNFTVDYYAEFQYLKYNPALVGDSIDIVYCLPQNDTATTVYQDYYYLISLWRNQEMVDYKYLYITMNKLNQTIFNNGGLGTFAQDGDYQLKVYNCSSFTARSGYNHVYGLYYGTLFYESNELKVFKNLQAYNDYIDGTTQEHNDTEDNIFSDIVDDEYTYLIGFGFCLIVGIFVGYITMNGLAFTGGFLGSMVFLSIPNGMFTMFGLEVLTVCGFALVLIFMYKVFGR